MLRLSVHQIPNAKNGRVVVPITSIVQSLGRPFPRFHYQLARVSRLHRHFSSCWSFLQGDTLRDAPNLTHDPHSRLVFHRDWRENSWHDPYSGFRQGPLVHQPILAGVVSAKRHSVSSNSHIFLKLNKRYYGPYKVVTHISKAAYKLELPKSARIHLVYSSWQVISWRGKKQSVWTN